jgi:molecular chaperone GrpE
VSREEAAEIDDEQMEQAPVESAEQPPVENDEFAALQKQAKDYFDGWQRERADFNNYKRRVEREMKDNQQNATSATLIALLPILDDFERAMANLPEEMKGQPWLEGIAAIQRKFMKLLDDSGITIIDPVGEVFDPNRHEALGTDVGSNVESGHITVTLQKGYANGDRVLRPALVRVAG